MDAGKCAADDTYNEGSGDHIPEDGLVIAEKKNYEKTRNLACRIVPTNQIMNLHKGYLLLS